MSAHGEMSNGKNGDGARRLVAIFIGANLHDNEQFMLNQLLVRNFHLITLPHHI
jgi:hypothetical protein